LILFITLIYPIGEIHQINNYNNAPDQLKKEGIIPGVLLEKAFFKTLDNSRMESLKVILENYPTMITLRDEKRRTPLMIAQKNKQKAVQQLIREKGGK
jgi:hypothetical protein